jgi:hypothetical protein
MAVTAYQIESYSIVLGDRLSTTWNGAQTSYRGSILCYGTGTNWRLYLYFLGSGTPPASLVDPTLQRAALFFPFAHMMQFVDLLRHEGPLQASLDSDHPERSCISSGREAVGDAEH